MKNSPQTAPSTACHVNGGSSQGNRALESAQAGLQHLVDLRRASRSDQKTRQDSYRPARGVSLARAAASGPQWRAGRRGAPTSSRQRPAPGHCGRRSRDSAGPAHSRHGCFRRQRHRARRPGPKDRNHRARESAPSSRPCADQPGIVTAILIAGRTCGHRPVQIADHVLEDRETRRGCRIELG